MGGGVGWKKTGEAEREREVALRKCGEKEGEDGLSEGRNSGRGALSE